MGHVETWDFVVHKPPYGGGAWYVTAKCSNCAQPFWGNPKNYYGTRDEGTQIWSGFFQGVVEGNEAAVRNIACEGATEITVEHPLSKYCPNCGKRMLNSK